MTVGIYGIFDSETDECLYVGQSVNIERRWEQHKHSLQSKKHVRKDFVEWYHQNGAKKELITFRILEECSPTHDELNRLEINYFNSLKPKFFGVKPSENLKWDYIKFSSDFSTLNQLYNVENKSIKEIAAILECKERTVYYLMRKHSVPKKEIKPDGYCLTCGKKTYKKTASHCSDHRNDGKPKSSSSKKDSFCLECGKKTFNKTASYCVDHKSIALRKGAHKQWHVNRGIVKDDCDFCING